MKWRKGPALAALLVLSACTRTVYRTDYVRVPCLPSVAPIPTADYGSDEHAAQYVGLLGWVAYVQGACAVERAVDTASAYEDVP